MSKRLNLKKSIFVSGVIFMLLFSLFFCSSSIFSADTPSINLDLWKWEEEYDEKGNVKSLSLTEYTADDKDNCENIVIPNVCDFQLGNAEKYKMLNKVFINKSAMNLLAKKSSKYNGSLKVSNTENGIIVASDEDWSNCFLIDDKNNIQEIDLSHLDTRNIKNMSYMFASCSNLKKLDLSNCDTKNVENVENMLSGCENLAEINLSDFNTQNLKTAKGMFMDCKNLTKLDLSNFDTRNVENVENMFSGCENLAEINLSSFGTQNLKTTKGMFMGCKNLTKLDLSNFETPNIDCMDMMFKNTGLKILDLSGFVFKDEVSTKEMFDELSENSLLVLSDKQNFEVLKELTENRDAMNLKFMFNKNDLFYAFNGVVFCPSDIEITRKESEKFNDYLERILGKFFEIAENKIKTEELYSEGAIVSCQPKESYNTIEERLNGQYIFTAEIPLLEGTDFKWAKAVSDLKFDGEAKELVEGGFIREELKNEGVKIEYSFDGENWSCEIPTGTEAGIYKVYQRINGGEKYKDVRYVNEDGNIYIKVKIYESELQDGVDYRFARALNNLKYDGKEKELLFNGFVSKVKKNEGVKIEYSFDGINWSCEIPKKIEVGIYKVYQRINGAGKYKDVVYNVNGKAYVEAQIFGDETYSKKKNNSLSWNTIENSINSSTNEKDLKKNGNGNNPDKTLKMVKLPERFRVQKYLSGYPDGQIRPSDNMTRAEFVNMIYKLMYDGKEKINLDKLENLYDVKSSDWYGICVAYLLDKNIIGAEYNNFRPNENITRGEVAEILFDVLKFYDAEKSKKYDYGNAFYNFSDADKFGKFDEAIKQLASNNIINGYEDKTFRADKNITRAEVAKIIFYASDRESNLGQKIYSDLNKNYWAYKFLMDASA